MYLLIVLMPLVGSIISGFFGRNVGTKGSQYITCSLVLLTTISAVLAFLEIGLTSTPVSINLLRWIDLEYLNVFLAFNFDSLTTLMLIPVLFVSSAVHIYSIGYMSHDPHNQRFFSYLSLFTFMMIILVTANNYLLMFVGWEGVGICSYLLVSFWFTRIAANQSSVSAILTNRVGDCFLTIGMFAILWSLGNLDYTTVFSLAPFINENIITIIGICLLIGAMAKSSQIGLHVWLPMAMEGPTPVSALIHAATMVTAGVYLMIRSSPLIEYSTTVLLLCLWVGAITTLFSSLIGLFQQDIKKVIAYSTMSQLGLMVVAIGLSSYTIALYHLVNHAFYKALLFLGAGAVIHAVADKQDFRKYGGLKQFLPLSYSVMLIASLSLVAFPFMTGYFSKDFILESCYGKFGLSSIIVYYIATIGAMFTTLYSIKTLYLTFITNPNGTLRDYKIIHEGNIFMSLPLIVLALFSIYFGFFTKDIFIGLGSGVFTDNSIFIHPSNDILINTEFAVLTIYKLLPFIMTVLLTISSLIISEYLLNNLIRWKFSKFGNNMYSFFNLRFSIELIYNKYITETVLHLGGHTTKVLDKGAIELIGPYGLQNNISYISKSLSSLDTGIVTTYALYIFIGAFLYLYLPIILFYSICVLLILLLSMVFYRTKSVNTKTKEN
uniref:NADH dehydrogenase subunit 5 n=1 Tax=Gyalideopsis ozarkensis TaxID=2910267 RepID=UPI001EE0256B|nr:NADH dehydrogenase subunit 5 [Gyalideopsis ozarkensis]UIX51994.1 NADH dehydrogenase subunit 5 [Gyalideopsis ozarkensis]